MEGEENPGRSGDASEWKMFLLDAASSSTLQHWRLNRAPGFVWAMLTAREMDVTIMSDGSQTACACVRACALTRRRC